MSRGWGKGVLSAPLLGCAQFTPRGYLRKGERGRSGIDPVKDGADVMRGIACGQGGPVDHQDRQAKASRSDQLGLCPAAARILGDYKINAVGAHHRFVRGGVKRAAIKDDVVIGQGWRICRGIDKSQEVVVLGPRGECGQMHPPEGKKDAAGRAGERGDGGLYVGDSLPAIAWLRRPGRAGERQKRCAGHGCSRNRIGAHPGRERMGGIHQMGDGVSLQIVCQPADPAEAAHTHGHRLGFGARNPACIAERRGKALRRETGHEARGLDRAAKDKDIRHG